ncbi:diguanylate cyclase [Iamia sp. SCSIO 61187]|uniref:sensor domain-containing diguanylate cyclase n=1 Tax=Iamia sp. SCSIO 61187 TaxID=2722752 RepID=UPI001C62FC7B|nr:sensor domain-containing diguanylate cyclase [Iamia sp. SCSIO 61187]QYG95068.1 diguanylate cyclase [Iamia sp. SCSIO 61187]
MSERAIGTGTVEDRRRRRILADHRARLAIEEGMQRCRFWFAGIAIVQLLLYEADRPWVSAANAAALVLVWLAVRWAVRRGPTIAGVRRLGWAAMAADTLIIAVAMVNLLRDPTDPVQMLPVIVACEAALRWGRFGGLGGGLLAGVMAAAWSVAAHRTADVSLPSAFVTFRVAVMVGVGVLLGSVMSAAVRERRRAETISDASSDLIATFGFDGQVRSVNPACEAILGYRPEELIGIDRADLIVEEDRPGGPPDVEGLRREQSRREELRFVHRDGHHVWLEVDLQVDVDERLVCAIGRDVSERRRTEAELRRRADHDDLTGVANRSQLVARLARDLDDGRDVHLLFVDLDGFKAVNDAHGHRAGDVVLQEVAGRIRAVGEPEDLVARLAGDEFCVLLAPPSDDARARRRAADIETALARPYDVGDTVVVGASVGWAASCIDDRPADLLERADLAMYAAKRARRRAATA